jgi:hypothetical protein
MVEETSKGIKTTAEIFVAYFRNSSIHLCFLPPRKLRASFSKVYIVLLAELL